MLIDRLLLSHKTSERPAIVCGTAKYSYRQLYQIVAGHASFLQEVVSGPAIGIWLPNGTSWPVAYLSVAMLHKTIVPIGANLTAAEAARIVSHCELHLLITDTAHFAALCAEPALLKGKLFIYIMETRAIHTLNPEQDFCPITTEEELRDVFILLNTSGTSDNPKVVMLTEQNLAANINSIVECMGIRPDDRTLIVLPLSLSSGHIQMLTHLYSGACLVILEGPFFPPAFFVQLQQQKITNFCCVTFILKTFVELGVRHSFPYLRHIGAGGGFVPASLLESLVALFPEITFYHYYGQTEASPRITQIAQKGFCQLSDSIGKAIPGVSVRICHADGTSCAPGEEGEVTATGKNIMKGYFKNAAATSEALQDGWLHTGDIAVRDEEGYIFLRGRKKNIIISNGINIYPEDIEAVLVRHPQVKEAFVYAKEDADYQQIPAAKIISCSNLTADELILFCRQHLATYKIPKHITFCSALPKTETGKLKRT